MSSDMRKLMETMSTMYLTKGPDPEGIAQAIYNDVKEGGSALELAAERSPEPYRAMVYEFGNLTGLYNAEALDGSEIWKRIIDKLEALFDNDMVDEDVADPDMHSDFRLAEIIGKDGLAELLADLEKNDDIEEYDNSYFKKLYWHFLDEYPDEIPVGSRTGRPEDPADYVRDNLERYHMREIEQHLGHTLGNKGMLEDDGDVPSSDEETSSEILKKVDSALKFIAIGMKNASEQGLAAPLDAKQKVLVLRRKLKEIKAYLESGKDLLRAFSMMKTANIAANTLADYSYDFDQVQMEVQDAENLLYSHLNKRPATIDESDEVWEDYVIEDDKPRGRCVDCGDSGTVYNSDTGEDEECISCSNQSHDMFEEKCEKCGREGCTCGPDCDCEPVKESGERPYICVHAKKGKHECHASSSYGAAKKAAEHWGLKSTAGIDAHLADVTHTPTESVEDISLDSLVESLLGEDGQPKDYEMSDEELVDGEEENERDHIDAEIEDEELGMRFD